MTVVAHNIGPGARTHAFVVGVDRYPFCGPGTEHSGSFKWAAQQIRDLTCATPSALATARWLQENLADDTVAPLGSIELLISASEPTGPMFFDTAARQVEVERATFGNVRRAFEGWQERCDTDPDNIALFFFHGHGCHIQADDILLLEDVCESRAGFFENAVDFGATYRAMANCAARIQCYFIDACRDLPEELGDLELRGRPLMTAATRQPPRDAPIVYSTSAGARAYGIGNEPTAFTKAVLQTLGGLAARQDDEWTIGTWDLGSTVGRLMKWNAWPAEPPQYAVQEGSAHGGTIRTLAGAPQVPFRIACSPPEALEFATLTLDGDADKQQRPPQTEAWRSSAPADSYQISATFDGAPYADAACRRMLVPPHHGYAVPVRPR